MHQLRSRGKIFSCLATFTFTWPWLVFGTADKLCCDYPSLTLNLKEIRQHFCTMWNRFFAFLLSGTQGGLPQSSCYSRRCFPANPQKIQIGWAFIWSSECFHASYVITLPFTCVNVCDTLSNMSTVANLPPTLQDKSRKDFDDALEPP